MIINAEDQPGGGVLSLTTGNWRFFLWSLPPALLAGITGLIASVRSSK